MVVVVVEPFGEVLWFIFDEEAEGEVFFLSCGLRDDLMLGAWAYEISV